MPEQQQPQEAPKSYQPPLPPAVARLAAQASELQEQVIQSQNEPPADGASPEEQPSQEAQPEPAAPPLEQQPPQEEPEPAPAEGSVEYWRRRYQSIKGRYDKEVPGLKSQVGALSSELTNLQGVVATMEQRFSQPAPVQQERLITDEELEEYGPEFVDLASRIARESQGPLLAEIETLRAQIGGVKTFNEHHARQNLYQSLDKDVPDWRNINRSQEFISWLGLPDAYSGSIRQEMLNAAFARHDAPRVAAFFNGFLSEQAATAPAEPDERDQQHVTRMPKVPLGKFAAPGRAKPAATQPPARPAEKPIITAAQIAKFYSDRARGVYRGRESESQQMEAQIFEAQNEGRIR